jgi:hypothetical protein
MSQNLGTIIKCELKDVQFDIIMSKKRMSKMFHLDQGLAKSGPL